MLTQANLEKKRKAEQQHADDLKRREARRKELEDERQRELLDSQSRAAGIIK